MTKMHKFWYGYKKYVSVNMKSGLINKIAITVANILDSKALVQEVVLYMQTKVKHAKRTVKIK